MGELIKVVQLPVILEQLHTLKDRWQQHAADAAAMVCTEDTVKAVKAFRADMRKEFEDVETLRKAVKAAVMGPYEQFEAVYKDCVTMAFRAADSAYAEKINDVEAEQKRRCEEGLREYFAELCAVRHLVWLEYERAGVRVDMASAKAKTPKRLREQLAAFVQQVGDSVDTISGLENADEIMVEYRQTLDAAAAIRTVLDRHQRIEKERAAQEERKTAQAQEAEAVRKVEALAPPVPVEPRELVEPQPICKCVFTVHATKEQLKKLKKFLEMEEIPYE